MPRRRYIRKKIRQYRTLYRAKGGNEITITTFQRPPKYRTIRNKKYKAVRIQTTLKECIIVAKATKEKKNAKSAEVTDTELEELEALEDLDVEDDEDEVEDVEVDEDDDDDEEEAPAAKKVKKPAPSRSRTTDGKVGTAELAAFCGIEPRMLRMVLRKHKIAKDEETGRYEWDSLKDPEVKKIKKLIDAGEHKQITKDALQKLKDRPKPEKEGKKGKKNKKAKKVVEEDEDDE